MDTKPRGQNEIGGMLDDANYADAQKRAVEKAASFGERYKQSPDAFEGYTPDAKTAELKKLGMPHAVEYRPSKQELDVARAKKLAARASRKAERQRRKAGRR